MQISSFFLSEGATLKDDVLENVVLLGPVSKNGNEYSPAAMRSAVGLYQGMAVYANHAPKGTKARSLEDRFGHIENARYVESENKVRGNVRFLASHPMATRVREAVEKGYPYFGMSHVADGKGRVAKGKRFVEEVTKVMSVDIVDNAATCSLVEQEGSEDTTPDAFSQAIMGLLADASLTKDSFLEKAGALWDTLKGDGGNSETPAETTQEQTVSKAELATLIEQAIDTRLKNLKYLPAKSGNDGQGGNNPAIPKDKKNLAQWLRTR